jgi:hypothetical protein
MKTLLKTIKDEFTDMHPGEVFGIFILGPIVFYLGLLFVRWFFVCTH